MDHRSVAPLAIALAMTLQWTDVSATIITVEPDNYQPGEQIVADGAKFWTVYEARDCYPYTGCNPLALAPVYSAESSVAVTGDHVFAHPFYWGVGWEGTYSLGPCFADVDSDLCNGAWGESLLVQFDSPTDFVQILGRSHPLDAMVGFAYDSEFNLISMCGDRWLPTADCTGEFYERPGEYFQDGIVTFQTSKPMISYVIFGGTSAPSLLDRLTYSVPEPGTLALLGLGLFGLGLSRRRKAN